MSDPIECKKMFSGTRAILTYRRERDLLIREINFYITALQFKPKGNHLVEITLSILGLAMQINRVKWAAEAVGTCAKDMKYVTSKPPGFFSHTIPERCDRLSTQTNAISHTLSIHTIHPMINIEMILASDLDKALTDMGF